MYGFPKYRTKPVGSEIFVRNGNMCNSRSRVLISEAAATWRTRTRSVFVDTRVKVVLYCSFHNLDRGFIILPEIY
jgi:hypothetical protein